MLGYSQTGGLGTTESLDTLKSTGAGKAPGRESVNGIKPHLGNAMSHLCDMHEKGKEGRKKEGHKSESKNMEY